MERNFDFFSKVSPQPVDRAAEPRAAKSLPGWRQASLALSLAYLLFEVGFSARLLDAVGAPGRVDVGSIEIWGRILSGLALSILVWSAFILPRAARRWDRWKETLWRMALVGLVIVGAVYLLQEALVRQIVSNSSGQERRSAIWLTTVSAAIGDGRVGLDGIEVGGGLLSSPEGKSMLAFLPFAAGRAANVEARAEPVVRAIVENRLHDAMGTPRRAWDEVWVPARTAAVNSWNPYAEADAAHSNAIASIPRRQSEAMRDYEASLARSNLRIGNIPVWVHGRVRSDVQGKGNPVRHDWNPNDRAGFNAAVAQRVRQDADKAWRDGMAARGGSSLPRGLSQAAFFSRPEIQEKWREQIGLTTAPVLDPRMTYADWLRNVWEVERRARLDAAVAAVMGNPEDYADGGRFEAEGRRAVEAVVVPPIALVFSLLGAASHISKIVAAIVALTLPRFAPWGSLAAFAATFLGVVAVPTSSSNAVAESAFYAGMEREARMGWGDAPTTLMRWVVLAQPMAYPVGDAVRRTALLGLKFGVSDEATQVPVPDEESTETATVTPAQRVAAATPVPTPSAAMAETANWATGVASCGGIPVLAHRGARPNIENTLEAIRAARSGGYQASEIDAQRTSDGLWVLHHDAVVGRVVNPASGGVRPVSRMSSAEWRSSRLRGTNGSAATGQPATLANAVEDTRAAGGKLEIEIKTEATCGEVGEALGVAAPLGASVRWTSVYRGTARCLAARMRAGGPGAAAGYVGLIVGPPQESVAAQDGRAAAALRVLGSVAPRAADRWETAANREFASPEGIRRAADILQAAPRRGIHLPASDIERHPSLPGDAAAAGLRVTLYGDRGDEHIARVVRSMRPEDHRQIDALVVDGNAASFCRAAFGR